MYKIIKQVNRLLALLFFFISICFSQSVSAQQENSGRSNIADSLFLSQNYTEALKYYTNLLKNYPQEPSFHYKLGVSYLKSTRDIEKAIEHLKFASTKEIPSLVYYYLGKSYQKNYQFDEAISYYRRFIINGGDPSITIQQIEQLVGQCENGNFMLRYIYQPEVIDRKKVSSDEFNQFIVTKSPDGSFIPLPKDLLTTTDLKNDHTSIIFYPNNPKIGDKIVYSSYGSTTSFGKDLFIIEMLNDGFWSKPQNLGDLINSNLDEDYPYLAPDGITLYFASKGHYSMGGFDIYRSVFNPTIKQWSTPENLGFPISSTFDDILYIPSETEDLAIIVSNRNISASDSIEIFLLEINDSPIRRAIDSNETIRSIAQLTPVPQSIIEQRKTVDHNKSEVKSSQQALPASFSEVENDPEYIRALANGFSQQMRADSLRIRLEALRARFDFITTAEARRNLESQVVKVEDDLLASQREADIQFARASQIEQEYLTGKRKPADESTSSFATDHPDFLYQAQFASTVFQADELIRLSQIERVKPQIERERVRILELSKRITELRTSNPDSLERLDELQNEFIQLLAKFTPLFGNHINGKKKLYQDCIAVALIKAGANNNLAIKSHIDLANRHFRSATAIRNNAAAESKIESEYEALLLDELGVLRLEIAFAKLWEMQLFEQQLLSKVYRLEQNIFGHTLTTGKHTKPTASSTVTTKSVDVQTYPSMVIERIESKPLTVDGFVLEPESEPPFQILEITPYSNENPFLSHDPLPDGVIYKIQLISLSNPPRFDLFKGMVPISAEPVNQGRVTKYYAGNFTNLLEAEKALPAVRSHGFKDAFIVAWHNGRSITLTRAKALEESSLSQSTARQDTTRIEIAKDDKLYVIQLGAFTGTLPSDVAQTIRALAPGKDIVRKPDNKGGLIYSIGSYSDLNEANRVKDNLVASGIKSAFVVAVETDN